MMHKLHMFFRPGFQMSVEVILKFIVVVLILYIGYQLILKHTPLGGQSASKDDSFMNYTPAPALVPDNVPMPILEGPRTVMGSGPSAPSQAAPHDTIRVIAEPEGTDGYAEMNEGANAPERLRHPERMFRPAPPMDVVDSMTESGIGAAASEATANSLQTFAPEFAQNGGEFMNGIFANDTSEPSNFSAF